MFRMTSLIIIISFMGLWVFVRFWQPSVREAFFDRFAETEVTSTLAGGYTHKAEGVSDAKYQELLTIIEAGQSTTRKAVDGPGVVFQTRTKWVGFPDITRVIHDGGTLLIQGHLVYGRRDFGINKARIQGWLNAAGL